MAVFIVDDLKQVKVASRHFINRNRGLIFLDDKYAVGVDIKCGDDAAVFIFRNKYNDVPERE